MNASVTSRVNRLFREFQNILHNSAAGKSIRALRSTFLMQFHSNSVLPPRTFQCLPFGRDGAMGIQRGGGDNGFIAFFFFFNGISSNSFY